MSREVLIEKCVKLYKYDDYKTGYKSKKVYKAKLSEMPTDQLEFILKWLEQTKARKG